MPLICTALTWAASGTFRSKPSRSSSRVAMAATRHTRKTTQPFQLVLNTHSRFFSSISAMKQPTAPHSSIQPSSVQGPWGSRG